MCALDSILIDKIAWEVLRGRAEHTRREPDWLYYHGHRTGKIALWLADKIGEPVDRHILYTGALFHDIAKGTEPHHEIGASQARGLLSSVCTATELDAISKVILYHNQRNNPEHSPDIKIVQDADLLDHVGVIGPWLAFYWSGSRKETIDDHLKFFRSGENLRHQQELRSSLNFAASVEEFDRRIEYEDEFFNRFHQVYMDGI